MNCIYFERFGSKDNKKECLRKLIEYQNLHEKGKLNQPMMIFPEGTTTNGEAILGWKPGAFIAESSI